MSSSRYLILTFSALFLLFYSNSSGQIIFKELPKYQINSSDSVFFDITETRKIIPLNGTWKVYPAGDKESPKASVTVPSIFKGDGELIFEKSFSLSKDQLSNHKMRIFFLGLNYLADISVNNIIIYRHTGGEFPFYLDLPKDILHHDKANLLSVKLIYNLDSENTIPVKQRFLFPQNFGGIFRDVFIHLSPNISINETDITYNYDPKSKKARVDFNAGVENMEFRNVSDTLESLNDFTLKISLISADEGFSKSLPEQKFELKRNKSKIVSLQSDISSPLLWEPLNPKSYLVRIEVWRDENLIDVTKKLLSVYSLNSLKDSLELNGSPFSINGVCYVPSFSEYGSLARYDLMERDIRLIKETGFNSVRFSRTLPHPYFLNLCEKYGLLAFIELPLNYIPGSIMEGQNFIARSKDYLTNLIKAYNKYSAFAAVGLGSSYLPGSDAQTSLITDLAELAQKNTKALTYASFAGYDIPEIDNLDLYGVEFFNKSLDKENSELNELQEKLGKGKVFLSEATYTVNIGNTNGYVNEYSFEAQAKFFEEILDYADSNPHTGYFLNSMFDYRGDYASLIAGYTSENVYNIGIVGEDRSTDRLAYKIISAKLHNAERVTIPIGSRKDDSPMIFIISGLLLAIIMGVLVNSGKKFREDSSRALLRPYNFYADIRDHRMVSGLHATLLLVVVSAVMALLTSNILFYLKTDIVFEKFILSFGSSKLINVVSYFAWNSLNSIFWLTLIFLLAILILIAIIKIASLFVKHRVYLSNVYFSVIWSFLPVVLLIPVGIILYRLLNADIGNLYIYIILLLFGLWILHRLMKGIYVIFDVNPGGVYFYGTVIFLLITGAFILYFQLKNSFLDYIFLVFRQYNIL